MQSSTVTGRINAKAFELLQQHPEGLHWSELLSKIEASDPTFHPKTVNGCVWKLVEKFPDKVYKPSKGLFRLLKYKSTERLMKNNLNFRKISSTEPVVEYLTVVISQHLSKGKRVFWLVPGGSAIRIVTEVAKRLAKEELTNLTVTLTDERYGPIGHKDSNWAQLEAAGCKLDDANLQPVLVGLSLNETTDSFSKMIKEDLRQTDYSIALAGMGPDGHIFGIKPKSPAVDSDKLVAGYKWDDFIRLTLTTQAIKQLDEVVIYAVGEEKKPQLDDLSKRIPATEQPAQILKELKKVIIFNDYKSS